MIKLIVVFRRVWIRCIGQLAFAFIKLVNPGLKTAGSIKCKNIPQILILDGASITLANQVVLNSANFGYHLSMYKPVKLFAEGAAAKITIGANTRVNGSCIHARQLVSIGENVLIGANSAIFDSNGHPLVMDSPHTRLTNTDEPRAVHIGDNVWLGAGVTVLPGTTIGSGSVIASGSVVRGNVPANCIFGGNPAQLIKQY